MTTQKSLPGFLRSQLQSRIQTYQKKNPQALDDFEHAGHTISPAKILSWLPLNEISSGFISPFHGDLQFSNIIVRPDGTFCLIDWREDLCGEIVLADPIYDLAKLNLGIEIHLAAASLGGLHIKRHHRQIEISPSIPVRHGSHYKTQLKKLTDSMGIDFAQVELLTSTLLLTMSGIYYGPLADWVWHTGLSRLAKIQARP